MDCKKFKDRNILKKWRPRERHAVNARNAPLNLVANVLPLLETDEPLDFFILGPSPGVKRFQKERVLQDHVNCFRP